MSACPGSFELSSGLRHERHPWRKHIAACPHCAAEVASLQHVRDLARNLPIAPDNADVAERRVQLLTLADARPTPSRRRHFAVAALVAASTFAVALVLVLGLHTPSHVKSRADTSPVATASIHRGTVHAQDGARYSLVGSQPDEIVRVTDGTILVEVDSLRAGERFRVVVGDAAVEVRGTAFEVTVAKDRFVDVRVRHGRVEVRHLDDAIVSLGAGESWATTTKTEPVEPVITAAVPPPAPKHRLPAPSELHDVAPTRTTPPLATSPTASESDAAFQAGVSGLRDGNMRDAARSFERAIAIDATGPLVEDSRFWLGVARGRGGDPKGAIRAFEDFLALHPRSTRAGKASAMLGWILVEAKDLDGAKRRFESAVDDPDTEVRESAAAGLAELARLH